MKTALDNGLAALELHLIQCTGEWLDNLHIAIPEPGGEPGFDVAISLLRNHKKQQREHRRAWNAKPIDVEGLKEMVVRKVRALESMEGKKRDSAFRLRRE